MNVLFKLKKTMPIVGIVPFKYLLYSALLSSVTAYTPDDEDTKYGVFSGVQSDLYDYYPEWDSEDDRRNEILKALSELADEGLLLFDEDERIYLGEYRGKRFFPFEAKSSMFDTACEVMFEEIKWYGKSKSAKDKSRSRYIKEQIERFLNKGIENLNPGDFTEIHGLLYEVYTGGEVYIIRSKVENFQTKNMLKAYDKFTTFSLIVEATLHYDSYRKKGVPTLTNVACMKDDVFRSLTKTDSGSKDYMREMTSSIDENSTF